MEKFNNVEESVMEKTVVDDEFRSLFKLMLSEVLDEKRYDTLVSFVSKYMEELVRSWCSGVPYFNHEDHRQEILQLIRIKLMQKVVNGFIFVNGVDAGINNDPDGFKRWMFTVAKNVKRDYFKRERRIFMRQNELPDSEWNVDHESDPFNGMEPEELSDDGEGYYVIDDLFVPDYIDDARAQINKSFKIVMSCGSNVYIPLTWLAASLYICVFYKTKKQANNYVVTFGESTLNELYEAILELAKYVPWLVIDDDMKKNMEKSLSKQSDIDETRTFGECKYCEFYGEKPTVRVSDWIYRMTQRIIKMTKDDKDNGNENGNK